MYVQNISKRCSFDIIFRRGVLYFSKTLMNFEPYITGCSNAFIT